MAVTAVEAPEVGKNGRLQPPKHLSWLPENGGYNEKRHAEACPTPECAPQNQLTRTFRLRRRLAMAILLPPAPAVAEQTFKSARETEQRARLPSFSHGTKGRQAQGARRQRGPAFVGSAKRDTPRERRRQPPPSRLPVARASTTGRSKMAQSKVAYGNALGGNRPSGRQGRGAGRFLPGMPARGRRVADAAGLGLSCARDAATAAPTRS